MILGGSRQDNDWSEEWDEQLCQQIMQRCCALCPELGRPEDLQVIAKNVGLRREFFSIFPFFRDFGYTRADIGLAVASRKGGMRIETETGKWNVPVVHCYGHAGAGFQSSW